MKKNQAQAQETTNNSAASAATTVTEIKDEEKKDDDDVAMGQVRPKETAPEVKKVDNVATSAASASAAAAESSGVGKAGAAVKTDIQVDKTISTYNGAKTEKYNWSQNIQTVDV